jgi:hypothetical protein
MGYDLAIGASPILQESFPPNYYPCTLNSVRHEGAGEITLPQVPIPRTLRKLITPFK